MTKPVLAKPTYQVIGRFLSPHCPPVCHKGETGDYKLARERLEEAEAYTARRMRLGGERMKWTIQQSARRANDEYEQNQREIPGTS